MFFWKKKTKKTDETVWNPPPPTPFSTNSPISQQFFHDPSPLFVQILKTRTPPPHFRGGGGNYVNLFLDYGKKKLLYFHIKKPIVFTRKKLSIPMKKAIQQDQNSLVNFTKESFFVYKHKHYEFIWIITQNSELSLHNCSQSQYDKR